MNVFRQSRRASFVALVVLLVAGGLPAVAQFAPQGQPMLLPVDPVRMEIDDHDPATKDPTFSIEVADNDGERSAGLMFRKVMPDDRGMLFVFEETRRVAFWMKNTPMPLDLVFIGGDGKVKSISPGTPFSEASIPSSEPVRFVLELKAGTSKRLGIEVGDRVRHPAVDTVAGR